MVATVTCRFCGRVNYETQTNCALCGKLLGELDTNTPPIGSISGDSRSGTGDDSKHWVIGRAGEQSDKRFEVTREGATVGRHPSQNKIVINDPEVSRIHARLSVEGDKLTVEDSSANGTYVNERRIERVTLRDGDEVRFGLSENNTFTYQLESFAAARAQALQGTGAAAAAAALTGPLAAASKSG